MLAPSPLPGSIQQQSSQPSQSPPAHYPNDWQTIGKQQDFYDERDCLHPSHNLASRELENRREDDVVLFNYSLNPGFLNGNPAVGGDSPDDDDKFFRVHIDRFMESDQFGQIVDPAREPPELLESRLGIIDFAQCYDTYDDILLNSIGKQLGLQKGEETSFMDEYLRRVRALPGRRFFRTGVSLLVPSRGSSEDRFVLFVSFPYFGKSGGNILLGPESESVSLLDFKRLGVDDPNPGGVANGGVRDGIGEILVHQARYMIFDNFTMATFRSKEDSTRDQVPLHRFQERIGAFRAMIHMIANRTDLELSTLRKLQASLCILEGEIDKMISNEAPYEDTQGMEEKQMKVRDLLTYLNTLSAAFFAAISVAERQIAVLQDLHSLLLTSHRTKTQAHEKRFPLRQKPFYRSITPIPILMGNREQIWPDTMDTINEVVSERKSFTKKIKGLVKNMDIRRKILSGFLKSDQAKGASSAIGKTAKDVTEAMESTKATIEKTQETLVQQVQTLSGFTVVTTAFLPLSFCTSYFGMNNVNVFEGEKLSRRDFWLTTGPVSAGVILLTVIIIIWKRPEAREFRASIGRCLGLSSRGETDDLESSRGSTPQQPLNPPQTSNGQNLPPGQVMPNPALAQPNPHDSHKSQ